MRRWFTILLLVLMPLQSIWAAAPACCLHKEGPLASQPSRHAQQHHAASASALQQQDQDRPGLQDFDVDCGCASCHLGGMLLLMPASAGLPAFSAASVAALPAAAGFPSADPSPIERPNWARAL